MFSRKQQKKRTEESNSRLGISDISPSTIEPTVLENPEEEMFPWVQVDEENEKIWRDCKGEINNMQQRRVPNSDRSLLDLARGKKSQFSQAARDNKLPTDDQLGDQFPHYASNIKAGLASATNRHQKISNLSEQLQPAGIKVEFPSYCVEEILNHLPNQTLENLLTCIKPQQEEANGETKTVSRLSNSRFFGGVSDLKPASVLEKQQQVVSGSRLYGSTLFCKADEQELDPAKQKEMAARCHC